MVLEGKRCIDAHLHGVSSSPWARRSTRRGEPASGGKRRGERERERETLFLYLSLVGSRRGCWKRERKTLCEIKTKRRIFCQRLLATVRWRPPSSGQNHAFLPHFFRISLSQSVVSISLPTANAGDEASMLPQCGRFSCFSLWRKRRRFNSRLDDSYCFIIKFAAHRVLKCKFKS